MARPSVSRWARPADMYLDSGSLATVNALTGDQQGRTVYLARGGVFTTPLYLNGVRNLNIDCYGSSALDKPLIDNTLTVNSANWVDYTGTQANTWYMTTANWGGGACAVLLDDWACHYRASIADLLLVYEHAVHGAAYPWTYFYDSGNSRMYVHTDGTDPTTMVTRRPKVSAGEESVTSGLYALYLASCNAINVKNVQVRCGYSSNVYVSASNNILLENVDSFATGNKSGTGQNFFNLKGSSRSGKMANITLRGCTGRDGFGTNNNGVEIGFVNNLLIDGCDLRDCRGNGVELWQSCDNVIVRKNRFAAYAAGAKFFDSDGDNLTHFQNVLFQNNLIQGRANYVYKGATGAGTESGPYGIMLAAYNGTDGNTTHTFSNCRAVNNTFDIDDTATIYQYLKDTGAYGAGDRTFRFKNNVVIQRQEASYASYEWATYCAGATAAGAWIADRNMYQFGRDGRKWQIVGAAQTSLANYKTQWDTYVATNEDNSVSPDAATATIATASTMADSVYTPAAVDAPMVGLADTTDPDYPTTDFNGATRARATAGAFEFP